MNTQLFLCLAGFCLAQGASLGSKHLDSLLQQKRGDGLEKRHHDDWEVDTNMLNEGLQAGQHAVEELRGKLGDIAEAIDNNYSEDFEDIAKDLGRVFKHGGNFFHGAAYHVGETISKMWEGKHKFKFGEDRCRHYVRFIMEVQAIMKANKVDQAFKEEFNKKEKEALVADVHCFSDLLKDMDMMSRSTENKDITDLQAYEMLSRTVEDLYILYRDGHEFEAYVEGRINHDLSNFSEQTKDDFYEGRYGEEEKRQLLGKLLEALKTKFE